MLYYFLGLGHQHLKALRQCVNTTLDCCMTEVSCVSISRCIRQVDMICWVKFVNTDVNIPSAGPHWLDCYPSSSLSRRKRPGPGRIRPEEAPNMRYRIGKSQVRVHFQVGQATIERPSNDDILGKTFIGIPHGSTSRSFGATLYIWAAATRRSV